ncbi:hypothetical protein [Haliea sp. E17]|uniref:hypothetical protein n=1 Tax=Haliea sp. E17 TaxID=3401576 RepID=UPI003AAB053A
MAHSGERTSDGHYPQLRDLGLGLVYALLALLVSGGVLSSTYLLLTPELIRQHAGTEHESARPWRISGKSLIARRGAGEETESGGMRITALEVGPKDTRSIYTTRVGFKADDYPYLQFRITGQNPGSFYYFIWRTAEKPDETSHIILPRINDSAHVSMLADNPAWEGTITEIGVDVYGELREVAQVVESLDFLPTSAWNLIRSIWSEWTGLETWNQRSAHHLMGGPYDQILPRPLAMACWAGGALVVLFLAGLLWRIDIRLAVVCAVLGPWLVIDMLWQRNLSAQLEESEFLFGGKTQHEKHLAELDSDLYQYALHLKEVLPEPGVKIYLLHNSPRRDYRRLKMQYYLLPHNIFNFGHLPIPAKLREGDYLLVLDQVPGLDYDEQSNVLRWNSRSIPVERIDDQSPGALYLYTITP